MALSWNEIKTRAVELSKKWENEASEDAEAKSFWDDFFNVFGMTRKRLASFEHHVNVRGGGHGFIDLFWPGVLLVEHKSKGRDLDKAYTQAIDYFGGLAEKDLPKYILVSDFDRFKLYDLETGKNTEFELRNLQKYVQLFGFIAGYEKQELKEEDPANRKAAELMANVYDSLFESGYLGHDLKVLLVRLLFLLFADDTQVFGQLNVFQNYIKQKTAEDGSDLGSHLGMIFQVLNTPRDKRQSNTDEHLQVFEYANGGLFKDKIDLPAFSSKSRQVLLEATSFDWSKISPAIFGSLFQGVMDKAQRRHLGAHYTSESNILKVIKPLFLDELYEELNDCGKNPLKLDTFHKKLSTLKFLDPACGCGNFLVIAFRELRLLELEVLKRRYGTNQMLGFDIANFVEVKPSQFYGIEIEEFPARIAETAIWLTDHQMNIEFSKIFGRTRASLPLPEGAHIIFGNALTTEWKEVVDPKDLSYILGNPPFTGKKEQTPDQKKEVMEIFAGVKSSGVLDYVACWYRKSVDYMLFNQSIKSAFVSTNSIVQGEQVAVLWSDLFSRGMFINFAHRSFRWSNEASGKAAVHCVIIGFSLKESGKKLLFDYEKSQGEPHQVFAKNINAYLVDGPSVFITNRKKHISDGAPLMLYGSMPIDNGLLILTQEEKEELIMEDPKAQSFIRQYMGGEEFINNIKRWCFWLVDISPETLRGHDFVLDRISRNHSYRLSSNREATKKLSNNPGLFGEIRQPNTDYLLIPKVSSENRRYIPIGFCEPTIIASGTALIIPNSTIYHFGILQSLMNNVWVHAVCGRMKSDPVYSIGIVYNNFPWPESVSVEKTKVIENAAQHVLDVRAKYQNSSLADLYDPLTMPADLVKAHQTLDKTVDTAYTRKPFSTDAERLEFLFELYKKYLNKTY